MIGLIEEKLKEAFTSCGADPAFAVIVPAQNPDGSADFQCNGARAAAGRMGVDAEDLANKIVNHIRDTSPQVGHELDFQVWMTAPGYINVMIAPKVLQAQLRSPEPYSVEPKKIVIDFGGPNVAKPMHVGHMRSLVIGDALQRVLRYVGHDVTSDIHFGDWGLQMGLLMAELGGVPDDAITIELLEETYPRAAAKAKVDAAFKSNAQTLTSILQNSKQGDDPVTLRWKTFMRVSMATVERELQAMNINFTCYKGESDAQPYIEFMLDRVKAAKLTEWDDDALITRACEPPMILQKSDGAALYATTDLATIYARVEDWNPDEIIYVTDDRQKLHFKQVFEVSDKAGIMPASKLQHVPFGTINGPDGKPLKTRDGGVPKLHDLIQEAITKASEKNPEVSVPVAMAALKFADLQNSRTSSYSFDLDKFLSFEGKTGPYLLYQCVRIKSILAKSVPPGEIDLLTDFCTEIERKLAFTLVYGFPAALNRTISKMSPKELADHAYTLAQTFSKFYSEHQIANHPARVALSMEVLKQLETCLNLLGIDVPEKM